MKRDSSEIRKRGYRPLPQDDDSDDNRQEYRHSEDLMAREPNFDASGGTNWPYVYVPQSGRGSPSKDRKLSVENGYLLPEETAEEKNFKLLYEKSVCFCC